jgi:hypothetical protein
MAVIIEVAIRLQVDRSGSAPEARFWLDSQCEVGLTTERELPLSRRNNDEWLGTLALDEGATPQFLYRLGVLAHEGAFWSLTIRNRTRGYTLLSDGDELGSCKAWLTGVCPIAEVNAQAEACGGGANTPSRKTGVPRSRRRIAPYLLLIDR